MMHPILRRNSPDWTDIEVSLGMARKHLQTAQNKAEYQAVGLLCREAIITLGKFVLNQHFQGKVTGASNSDSCEILGKLIDEQLQGHSNREMRAYVQSCLDLANAIQHSSTSNYAQASILTDACAALMSMIRVILYPNEAHPGKGIQITDFSSAETTFMSDCIFTEFDSYPVSITEGFKIRGLAYGKSFVTVHALVGSQSYTATLHKNGWYKNANRIAAARLLDELLVQLFAEKDKARMHNGKKTPT